MTSDLFSSSNSMAVVALLSFSSFALVEKKKLDRNKHFVFSFLFFFLLVRGELVVCVSFAWVLCASLFFHSLALALQRMPRSSEPAREKSGENANWLGRVDHAAIGKKEQPSWYCLSLSRAFLFALLSCNISY